MPRPSSYAVFCLKKDTIPSTEQADRSVPRAVARPRHGRRHPPGHRPPSQQARSRRSRVAAGRACLPSQSARWQPGGALVHALFSSDATSTAEIYTLSLHDALPICLTVPRLTLMSLIKMMLVMVSVAAISKTFGLLRFLLRLSFLAK